MNLGSWVRLRPFATLASTWRLSRQTSLCGFSTTATVTSPLHRVVSFLGLAPAPSASPRQACQSQSCLARIMLVYRLRNCFYAICFEKFISGIARTETNKKIANIVDSDLQLVVHVDNGSKKLVSLADLVCNVCRSSGATSLNFTEHDMQPKNQDLNLLSIKTCYFVKTTPSESLISSSAECRTVPLWTSGMWSNLRHESVSSSRTAQKETQRTCVEQCLGAWPKTTWASCQNPQWHLCYGKSVGCIFTLWKFDFGVLSCQSHSPRIISWIEFMSQVKVETGVPTKITSLKPKFWLTCSLTVGAKTAVQIRTNWVVCGWQGHIIPCCRRKCPPVLSQLVRSCFLNIVTRCFVFCAYQNISDKSLQDTI